MMFGKLPEFFADEAELREKWSNWDKKEHRILVGNLPLTAEAALASMRVDGIIGVDLLKDYRIWLRKGIVCFPPQCI